MVTLEKIDQVVERTGVTYEEARAALEEVGGDVLEAIIYLETTKKGFADNMSSNINDKKDTAKNFFVIILNLHKHNCSISSRKFFIPSKRMEVFTKCTSII